MALARLHTRGKEKRPMLHIVESTKPLDRVAKDLEDAVARHKFGVLGVHDLKQTMAKKGVEFARECRIFEVCNPHQAKKVLETNLEISTALPCRISVYEEGGVTKLATIKPTAMIELYSTPGLAGVAKDVEVTLEQIMAEAAG
jgi:uncharacterized protein (DUF302 family)